MRMTITLRHEEQLALAKVASAERRQARDQAAILIRESLERRGLLSAERRPAWEREEYPGDAGNK